MTEWNDDLRRRQHNAETGHAVLGSTDRVMGDGRSKWRPLVLPSIVLALGFLLAFVGPLPGLGLFMVMGGALALPITAAMVLLGTENPPVM